MAIQFIIIIIAPKHLNLYNHDQDNHFRIINLSRTIY